MDKKITFKHRNRKAHNWLIYKILFKFLRKNSELLKGCVYDLGCGERPFEAFILSYANKYVGVDWSNTPHKLKADVVSDLNKPLLIDDGVADVVFSISVLEHLCEPKVMLGEAFRILKPNGSLMLQVPWQWWIHEEPFDFYRYTPYGLNYLIGSAGFVDIKVEPMAGFFSTMTLKFNYFTLHMLRVPKPIRAFLKVLLMPFWFLGQVLAPLLDRLDVDWRLEAPCYWVVARKPD